jgi:hypothetical protein
VNFLLLKVQRKPYDMLMLSASLPHRQAVLLAACKAVNPGVASCMLVQLPWTENSHYHTTCNHSTLAVPVAGFAVPALLS